MLDIHALEVVLDADAGLLKAIDGLTLAIRRGETFALVGESGCGKSMTALALMRLLPDSGNVTQGRVVLEGQDVLALPESAMRGIRGGRPFAGDESKADERREPLLDPEEHPSLDARPEGRDVEHDGGVGGGVHRDAGEGDGSEADDG